MDYVYKACNPTILNLSAVKKDKFRIVGLQVQIINIFGCNTWSYIRKTLFLSMDYVYKACNPTILNLSVVKKDKFRIVGLQAQIINIFGCNT